MESAGSSETTRGTLSTQFHFQDYINFGTPLHIPNPKLAFLEWFVGFFEAEGSLTKWSCNNAVYRVEIDVTQKDIQLIKKIRSRLGFGRVIVFSKKGETYSRYYVNKKKHIIAIISLLNGNLVTKKKQEQLRIWLNLFNERHGEKIPFLQTRPDISLKNGWLSGFIEGDGGFYATPTNLVTTNKKGVQRFQVRTKFYITQDGETEVLTEIRDLFLHTCTIGTLTNGRTKKRYNRLEMSSVTCILKVIDYLQNYPLLGKRQITFLRWARLFNYRVESYPVTEKSTAKLKRLVSNIKTYKKEELVDESIEQEMSIEPDIEIDITE